MHACDTSHSDNGVGKRTGGWGRTIDDDDDDEQKLSVIYFRTIFVLIFNTFTRRKLCARYACVRHNALSSHMTKFDCHFTASLFDCKNFANQSPSVPTRRCSERAEKNELFPIDFVVLCTRFHFCAGARIFLANHFQRFYRKVSHPNVVRFAYCFGGANFSSWNNTFEFNLSCFSLLLTKL